MAPCGADITREEALGKPVIELFPSSNMKARRPLALPGPERCACALVLPLLTPYRRALPCCLLTGPLRRALQGKELEKFQAIVRAHDSFDMKLKRIVPGGGAALSYTAHFRCAL